MDTVYEERSEYKHRKLEETMDRYEKELFELFNCIKQLEIEERRILEGVK